MQSIPNGSDHLILSFPEIRIDKTMFVEKIPFESPLDENKFPDHIIFFFKSTPDDEELQSLFSNTHLFSKIRWLSFVSSNINYLPNINFQLSNLEGLDLYGNLIYDISAISSFICINNAPKLRYLNLKHNPIAASEFLGVSVIEFNPNILILNQRFITPHEIYQAISNQYDQEKINYENCGQYQINAALCTSNLYYPQPLHFYSNNNAIFFSHIETLDFSNMSLCSFNFDYFENLKVAILSNNKITELYASKQCPQLVYLDLRNNFITFHNLCLFFNWKHPSLLQILIDQDLQNQFRSTDLFSIPMSDFSLRLFNNHSEMTKKIFKSIDTIKFIPKPDYHPQQSVENAFSQKIFDRFAFPDSESKLLSNESSLLLHFDDDQVPKLSILHYILRSIPAFLFVKDDEVILISIKQAHCYHIQNIINYYNKKFSSQMPISGRPVLWYYQKVDNAFPIIQQFYSFDENHIAFNSNVVFKTSYLDEKDVRKSTIYAYPMEDIAFRLIFLESLSLDDCNIDNKTFEEISFYCANLIKLSLNNNHIYDLSSLEKTNMGKLENLSILNQKTPKDHPLDFKQKKYLRNLPSLEILFCSQSDIEDNEKEDLKLCRIMKNLKIINGKFNPSQFSPVEDYGMYLLNKDQQIWNNKNSSSIIYAEKLCDLNSIGLTLLHVKEITVKESSVKGDDVVDDPYCQFINEKSQPPQILKSEDTLTTLLDRIAEYCGHIAEGFQILLEFFKDGIPGKDSISFINTITLIIQLFAWRITQFYRKLNLSSLDSFNILLFLFYSLIPLLCIMLNKAKIKKSSVLLIHKASLNNHRIILSTILTTILSPLAIFITSFPHRHEKSYLKSFFVMSFIFLIIGYLINYIAYKVMNTNLGSLTFLRLQNFIHSLTLSVVKIIQLPLLSFFVGLFICVEDHSDSLDELRCFTGFRPFPLVQVLGALIGIFNSIYISYFIYKSIKHDTEIIKSKIHIKEINDKYIETYFTLIEQWHLPTYKLYHDYKCNMCYYELEIILYKTILVVVEIFGKSFSNISKTIFATAHFILFCIFRPKKDKNDNLMSALEYFGDILVATQLVYKSTYISLIGFFITIISICIQYIPKIIKGCRKNKHNHLDSYTDYSRDEKSNEESIDIPLLNSGEHL